MINYSVNCVMVFPIANYNKAQELFTYLSSYYGLNLDSIRGKCYQINYYDTYANQYTMIVFRVTVASEILRNEIWNTMQSYKQYCWIGDDSENQVIQKYDTSSPTYGSPLYNINYDHWGVDY